MGCGTTAENQEDGARDGCTSDDANYETKCFCSTSGCAMKVKKATRSLDENSLPIIWGIRQLKAHVDKMNCGEEISNR